MYKKGHFYIKFDKIYKSIISEAINVSDKSYTKYKAFGEFKIYRDYYNKSKKLFKSGIILLMHLNNAIIFKLI